MQKTDALEVFFLIKGSNQKRSSLCVPRTDRDSNSNRDGDSHGDIRRDRARDRHRERDRDSVCVSVSVIHKERGGNKARQGRTKAVAPGQV